MPLVPVLVAGDWLYRYGPGPDALTRASQHRGGPATGCCERQSHRERLAERRLGEIEVRVVRPQDRQPAVVGPVTGAWPYLYAGSVGKPAAVDMRQMTKQSPR